MATVASRVLVVSSKKSRYAAGARQAGRDATVFETRRDVGDIVELLGRELGAGDLVLIKGRNSQKLERVALALAGRETACELRLCDPKVRCDLCPMRARGWQRRTVAM